MAAEAEAAREARAKVIAAQGEHKVMHLGQFYIIIFFFQASRALAQAAVQMMESPHALQV